MIKSVAIVGSGALATFYAYKWGEEYDVSVLGSWVESIEGINEVVVDYHRPLKVCALLDWSGASEPDLVVWLTKTYKNESTLQVFKKLKWNCPVLILQNGIGQAELFKKELTVSVFQGITSQGAKLVGPGKVDNTGDGDVIVEQCSLFNGFPVVQTPIFEKIQLKKLAINAVLNPICALYKIKNGAALDGEPRKELERLINDCFPFFEKRGVFKSVEDYLADVLYIANATADNINSMLADVISGRPTEIESILGPINEELQSEELIRVIKKFSDK